VPWNRYDEVVDAMAAMADSIVVGDPNDAQTGWPVVSQRQRDRVLGYIGPDGRGRPHRDEPASRTTSAAGVRGRRRSSPMSRTT